MGARLSVAHELGYLLLHGYKTPHADRGFKVRLRSAQSSDGSVAEEIEANRFAAELLMPTRLLLERLEEIEIDFAPQLEESHEQLVEIAGDFKVSKQALEIRLSNLLG